MKNNPIFDLADTSDLPDDIVGDINKSKRKAGQQYRLKKLFELNGGAELDIDEIQVAYFRTYGTSYKRHNLRCQLHLMAHAENPLIERAPGPRGVYRLKSHE